jgi:hypothetical protein
MDLPAFVSLKKELLNQPKEEVIRLLKDKDLEYRVRIDNGVYCIGTRDWKRERVNLSIENNIVIDITLG